MWYNWWRANGLSPYTRSPRKINFKKRKHNRHRFQSRNFRINKKKSRCPSFIEKLRRTKINKYCFACGKTATYGFSFERNKITSYKNHNLDLVSHQVYNAQQLSILGFRLS